MLRRLSVENFILIDRLDLELAGGLNIITGETGAGKSILLGALSLLLGSRSESGFAMDASRNCIVEGTFDVQGYGLEELLQQNDVECDGELTVRRVVSPTGKSRAYVNDLPVQLSLLKDLGARLIDIHSQHQSLMLSADRFRIAILDSVAGNGALLADYKVKYTALQQLASALEVLREKSEAALREQEYIRFQSEQIGQARLQEGEQQELEAQQAELSHAAQIGQAVDEGRKLLSEDEYGVVTRLKAAAQGLAHVAGYYARGGELAERLGSALVELRDVERELDAESDRIYADPEKLERIDQRLGLIYQLQKKYGVDSVEALISLQKEYQGKLEDISSCAERIAEMESQMVVLESDARQAADALTTSRRKASGDVTLHVERLLSNLGMPGAKLQVEFEEGGALHANGADATRFLFTANRNTPMQPVEKVASGGEMSRLMLALKSLVAQRSMLPTVIFDEIDAGVSGRIADAMGDIISAMASHMQVVNITHLPQVASKGDTHFVVYKQDTADGTRSSIRLLEPGERVAEIAKMLSGSAVTDAAMAQAGALLNAGKVAPQQ